MMIDTSLLETEDLIVHNVRLKGGEYYIAFCFRHQWRPNTLPLIVFLRHYIYLHSLNREQAGDLQHNALEKLMIIEQTYQQNRFDRIL